MNQRNILENAILTRNATIAAQAATIAALVEERNNIELDRHELRAALKQIAEMGESGSTARALAEVARISLALLK